MLTFPDFSDGTLKRSSLKVFTGGEFIESSARFVAMGTDGRHPCIWGAGPTRNTALKDASLWLDGDDQELTVVKIVKG